MSSGRYQWDDGETFVTDDRDWSAMTADEYLDAVMDDAALMEECDDREAERFDDPDADPVFEVLTTTDRTASETL